VAILSHRLRAQGPRLAAAQARLGFIRECFVWRHHRWDQITRDDFQVITTGIGNIKRAQLHPVALEWLYDRKLVCRRIGVGGDWHPTDSKGLRQGPFEAPNCFCPATSHCSPKPMEGRAICGGPRSPPRQLRWLKTHQSAEPRRKYIGCVGRCCCRTRPPQPRRAFAMRVTLHADRMLASESCAAQPASPASGLWRDRGKHSEARDLLAPFYGGSSKASAHRCWKTPRLRSYGGGLVPPISALGWRGLLRWSRCRASRTPRPSPS